MFIVKYYLVAAIALLAAAYFAETFYFKIAFLWIGVSLLLVSFAYIVEKPSIFRKRQDGSIPYYIKWLFFPFFIGVQGYNSWARRRDSVPAIQKIAPNLYLACRLFPSDAAFLKEEGVHAILDATAEFDGLNWSAEDNHLAYLNVPVLDHHPVRKSDLLKAVAWMSHHIEQGSGVVVHCAMGRGRSVLITAAYLLASKAFDDVDAALAHITDSRATARLNKKQYKKLKKIFKSGALTKRKRLLLVVNPVSGGGAWGESKAAITQSLSQKFILQIETTSEDITAKDIAKIHLNDGFEAIIACGGDGTVNEVASVLIDSNVRLGIIPLGTTNALCHVLFGIQSKIVPVQTACDVILAQYASTIDSANCNDETMVLVAGLGFEQRMITMADRDAKNQSGEFAYIQALGSAIKDNDIQTYTMQVDEGEPEEIVASSIIIANAAPFTTLLAQGGNAPELDDGKLDMTILNTKEKRILPFATLGFHSLTGISLTNDENSDVTGITHRKIKEVLIKGDADLHYVIDGEVRIADKIHIKVNPNSLNILCLEPKQATQ